ncbi:MAG: MOSC N-terminal beta barrel domain-containing protein [Acidobacteriota bacterium]
MLVEIGHVEALFRYPVKSMGGERLEAARMGWHGLDGDRRLALRRLDDRSGFPWLTASQLPELVLFAPFRREEDAPDAPGDLPTHVRTPEGKEMPVFGEDLAAEVGRRHGAPVEMMPMKHGTFDEAAISVIATATMSEIGRLAGRSLDMRRFRPNVVLRLLRPTPFQEDEWVGGVLSFGEGEDAPAVAVTMRDPRCSILNVDPDSAIRAPEVIKAVVRANQNNAGIYATVTRIGRLVIGQPVFLRPAKEFSDGA